MKKSILLLSLITASLLTAACDETGGNGNIQIYVEPEWTLINGISPGDDEENIRDGWAVDYSDFILSIGEVTVGRSGEPPKYGMAKHYLVDLKNTPLSGQLIAEFTDVASGQWDRVGYALPAASGASEDLGTVPADKAAMMKDHGLAVFTRMTFTKSDGQRCDPADPARPCTAATGLSAAWELPFPSRADGCGTELETGLTVPSGGTAAVKLTIHADHFFFTAFRHTGVTRLVQHLIDADLDADGEITLAELDAVPITVLSTTIFDLSTVPEELNTLLDYVRWATITLPHYQSDGGCPERTPL
ncbi:MAG: hypothetical protein CVU65_13025 [Deltaproteobacteria bacterium HGW-Deltaproteobacteria-22]|nr:MAG: hypothetical protein CVU65_13025 [Deltaproteobacteria bacterium HGW-Deltaproteobacteria-22]